MRILDFIDPDSELTTNPQNIKKIYRTDKKCITDST